jgi:hypothetical protein
MNNAPSVPLAETHIGGMANYGSAVIMFLEFLLYTYDALMAGETTLRELRA